MSKDLKKFRREIRVALSEYFYSEGCSCCEHSDHKKHQKDICALLNWPKDADGSYDIYKYAAK